MFSISEPIGKDEFLRIYEETTELAMLMLAPFGIPVNIQNASSNVLSEYRADEDFTNMYRIWEDVISRVLFHSHGITDDRIASSMNLYFEKRAEHDVIQAVEKAKNCIKEIMQSNSDFVEIPFGDLRDVSNDDISNAVAEAMTNIWNTLKQIRKAFGIDPSKNDNENENLFCFDIDENKNIFKKKKFVDHRLLNNQSLGLRVIPWIPSGGDLLSASEIFYEDDSFHKNNDNNDNNIKKNKKNNNDKKMKLEDILNLFKDMQKSMRLRIPCTKEESNCTLDVDLTHKNHSRNKSNKNYWYEIQINCSEWYALISMHSDIKSIYNQSTAVQDAAYQILTDLKDDILQKKEKEHHQFLEKKKKSIDMVGMCAGATCAHPYLSFSSLLNVFECEKKFNSTLDVINHTIGCFDRAEQWIRHSRRLLGFILEGEIETTIFKKNIKKYISSQKNQISEIILEVYNSLHNNDLKQSESQKNHFDKSNNIMRTLNSLGFNIYFEKTDKSDNNTEEDIKNSFIKFEHLAIAPMIGCAAAAVMCAESGILAMITDEVRLSYVECQLYSIQAEGMMCLYECLHLVSMGLVDLYDEQLLKLMNEKQSYSSVDEDNEDEEEQCVDSCEYEINNHFKKNNSDTKVEDPIKLMEDLNSLILLRCDAAINTAAEAMGVDNDKISFTATSLPDQPCHGPALAYSIRSQLFAARAERHRMNNIHGIDTSMTKYQILHKNAATDAFAAFLVSGANDFELASGAEESLRASVVDQPYLEVEEEESNKVVIKKGVKYLRRNWMVGSYLAGYMGLEDSMGIDIDVVGTQIADRGEAILDHMDNFFESKEDILHLDQIDINYDILYHLSTNPESKLLYRAITRGCILMAAAETGAFHVLGDDLSVYDDYWIKDDKNLECTEVQFVDMSDDINNLSSKSDAHYNSPPTRQFRDLLVELHNAITGKGTTRSMFFRREPKMRPMENFLKSKGYCKTDLEGDDVSDIASRSFCGPCPVLVAMRSLVTNAEVMKASGVEIGLEPTCDRPIIDQDCELCAEIEDNEGATIDTVKFESFHDSEKLISSPVWCWFASRYRDLISILLYLDGDMNGALSCLRSAIELTQLFDGLSTSQITLEYLIDLKTRLGAILVEMDHIEEARTELNSALDYIKVLERYQKEAEVRKKKDNSNDDDIDDVYKSESDTGEYFLDLFHQNAFKSIQIDEIKDGVHDDGISQPEMDGSDNNNTRYDDNIKQEKMVALYSDVLFHQRKASVLLHLAETILAASTNISMDMDMEGSGVGLSNTASELQHVEKLVRDGLNSSSFALYSCEKLNEELILAERRWSPNTLKSQWYSITVRDCIICSSDRSTNKDMKVCLLSGGKYGSRKKPGSLCARTKFRLLRQHSNLQAMLAISLFRSSPSHPEHSIQTAQRGLFQLDDKFKNLADSIDLLPLLENNFGEYYAFHSGLTSTKLYDVSLILALGELMAQAGNVTSAITFFRKAALKQVTNPLPHLSGAKIYVTLRQHIQALLHANFAVRLDPSFVPGLIDLAAVYRSKGNAGQAEQVLSVALDMCNSRGSEWRDIVAAHGVSRIQKDVANKLGLNGILC